MIWLQILAYAGIGVFVLVTLLKFVRYSTMPLHLRWELYPVPHEKYRAEHGGSYYEEPEWWKKPIETTFLGELKEMLMEMLFIKREFEHNRSLWYFSFPFHAGIYLMLFWFFLIFASAISYVAGLGNIENLAMGLAKVVGIAGMILLTVGCAGLFVRRISDRKLRTYSSASDYFNLLFILSVVLTGFYAWRVDPNFSIAKTFAASLVTFTPLNTELPAAVTLHTALLSVLVAYIPTTKMSHYVAKYFTYHQILWEDHPNIGMSPLREKIKEVLSYKVKWSAPHIREDLTWAEEATTIEPILQIKAIEERRRKR
ncbi:respiratory nitrate reductase subunit gamma [Archaeoglobus neptunius]|uniref:respiratory nitrate reductase subunit gamma n=1 Tax=Archaeoglobus neptunius TaxID=2798580 RepID=UPI001926F1DD|nr:respiratory nitrate reductase subunit gamma [Archaeoglobus neptunius]